MSRSVLVLTLLTSLAVAETPRFELDGNTLKTPPVTYQTAKAKLTPASDPAITHVAAYLEAKSSISTLRIEVHSDNQGNDKANQALTEARALAVAKALVAKGVDCKRLIAVGFGATKPVAANDTPENKAANRRTLFVNAALRGKALGGMPLDGNGQVAGDPCGK